MICWRGCERPSQKAKRMNGIVLAFCRVGFEPSTFGFRVEGLGGAGEAWGLGIPGKVLRERETN